jgi:hypothetical protein
MRVSKHLAMTRGRRRALAALSLTLVLSGCGMQLRPTPVSRDLSLAGQWQLQAPPREAMVKQLQSVLDDANARELERERREARRRAEPDGVWIPPPAPADDAEHPANTPRMMRRASWEMREQREQQQALLNMVVPGATLRIAHTASFVEFTPDSSARRRFAGNSGSTLVTSFATLRVESGWQANAFVVHSRDSDSRLDIVERYQRQGNQLNVQVQLKMPDVAEQQLTANYVLAGS